MKQPLALVVDDEPDICELLEITLQRMGIDARSVLDLDAARQRLSEQAFDLCLTDMRLPDGNGIDLVRHISEHYPRLPVAVITAHGNVEAAVRALPFAKTVDRDGNRLILALDDPDAMTPAVVTALVGAEAEIQSVGEERHSLEEVYLSLVEKQGAGQ